VGAVRQGLGKGLEKVRAHVLVLLLDTNALLAVLSRPGRLGKKTEGLLNSTVDIFYLPISVFEIAIKHMVGKIRLNLPLSELLRELNFGSLPFRVEDALETYSLPSLVRHDPFDRLILATAKARGAKLVTSDRKLLELGFDWILDSSL
jgi:PIN domain nuclease of toxin-antitoxin system